MHFVVAGGSFAAFRLTFVTIENNIAVSAVKLVASLQ
jgi:hypothetical protein